MIRRGRLSIKPNVKPSGKGGLVPSQELKQGEDAPDNKQEETLQSFPAEVIQQGTLPSENTSPVTQTVLEGEINTKILTEQENLPININPGPTDGAESSESSRFSASALQRRKRLSTFPNVAKPRLSVSSVQTSRSTTPKLPPRHEVLPFHGNAPLVDSFPQPSSLVSENCVSPTNRQHSIGQQLSLPHLQTPVPQVPQYSPYKKLGIKDPTTHFSPVKAGDVPQKTVPYPLKERAKQEGIASDPEPSTAPKRSQPVSDRERIQKSKKLRELLKEEMKKERMKRKDHPGFDRTVLLDRSRMTMKDLIYYIPEGNPMTKSLEYERRCEGSSESTLNKEFSEKITAVTANKETLEEEEAEDMEEEDDGELLVPRVKVAEDGSIIIDEESLTVEVKKTKGPIVESGDPIFERGSSTTYTSFKKTSYSKPWSEKETEMFFIALGMVGTDFSMIGQLFPHRARLEIKNKFKREEKVNAWRIDKAFNERKQISFDSFTKLLEKVLADEEKKEKIVKAESAAEKPIKPRRKKDQNTTKKKSDCDPKTPVTAEGKEDEADLATAEKENEVSLNVLDPGSCHASTSVPSLTKKRKQAEEKKKKQEDSQTNEETEHSAADDSVPSESKCKEKEKAKPLVHEEEELHTFIGEAFDYADCGDYYDDDELVVCSLPEEGGEAKQPNESTSPSTVKDATSQKGDKLTEVRPAALVRSRLQKIKPNIVGPAKRKEASKPASTTENKAAQDAAEKDSKLPSEYEPEQQAVELISPSVTKKPATPFFPRRWQSSKLPSESSCKCEKQDEQKDTSKVDQTHSTSRDSSGSTLEDTGSQEEEQNGIKPSASVKRRFWRRKRNLRRAAWRRETPEQEGAAEKSTKQDDVEQDPEPPPECESEQQQDQKIVQSSETKEKQTYSQSEDVASSVESQQSIILHSAENSSECENQDEQQGSVQLASTQDNSDCSVSIAVEVSSQEGKIVVHPAAVVRGRFQRAKPNIRSAAGKRESLKHKVRLENRAEQDPVEKEIEKLQVCGLEQKQAYEKEVLLPKVVEKQATPPSSRSRQSGKLQSPESSSECENHGEQRDSSQPQREQDTSADFSANTLEDTDSQEEQTGVKPSASVERNFWRRKPKIWRAARRKETAEQEGASEKGAKQDAVEQEQEPPPECQSEQQDQKTVQSSEVKESQDLASPAESQKFSILPSENFSECETQDEQQDSRQLTSMQDNSDCSISTAVEEFSSKEGKQIVVKPAALVRGHFQRAKPNIRSAAGKRERLKQEIPSEDRAEEDLFEKEGKELQRCGSQQMQADQKEVLPPEVVEKQATSVFSKSQQSSKLQSPESSSEFENHGDQRVSSQPQREQDTSSDFSGNIPEDTGSQEQEQSGVKPSASVKHHFWRRKPNIWRAAGRRETSKQESAAEKNAQKYAVEQEQEPPPECESEQQDQKIVQSSEVKEKQTYSQSKDVAASAESQQSSILHSAENSSECENQDEQQGNMQLASTQDNSDCSVSIAVEEVISQEGKQIVVKSTALVRGHFQRTKPNLSAAGKRETSRQEASLENRAEQDPIEKESEKLQECESEQRQVDQKEVLPPEVVEKQAIPVFSRSGQSSKLQFHESSSECENHGEQRDSSSPQGEQDSSADFSGNAAAEARSQEEKSAEARLAALFKSCFQTSPSVGKAARREPSEEENVTENEAVKDATKNKSKAPPECEPDDQQQQADLKAVLSPEVIEEPSSGFSKSQQSNKLRVPERKKPDECGSSQFYRTQGTCPENDVEEAKSLDGEKITEIKSTDFKSCFHKPEPNIRSTTGREYSNQESVTENEAFNDITEKESKTSPECVSVAQQQQADQQTVLSLEVIEKPSPVSGSQHSNKLKVPESKDEEVPSTHPNRPKEDDSEISAVEESRSQEGETTSEVKSTALLSRFQMPKPSIRRTSERESLKQESVTENEAFQDSTEKESEVPPECELAVQQADQKTVMSPEVMEKPSPVSSGTQQTNTLQVPEGKKQVEEGGTSQLNRTQEDCPKNAVEEPRSQEQQTAEVKPTALLSYFHRPEKRASSSESSKQESVLENAAVQVIIGKESKASPECEPVVQQQQANQKSVLSAELIDEPFPVSSDNQQSNKLQVPEVKKPDEQGNGSLLNRTQEDYPENAVEEAGSQEGEKTVEVKPGALISPFQRPMPNIRSVAGSESSEQESVAENEAVEDSAKMSEAPLECAPKQQQADQKSVLSPDVTEMQDLPASLRIQQSNKLLGPESRTQDEEDCSQLGRTEDTCPANAVEEAGSQKRGQQSPVKPAVLLRSRFQRPKPNLGKASGRREVSGTTEGKAAIDATGKDRRKLPEHESEHADHNVINMVEKSAFTYSEEAVSLSKSQQSLKNSSECRSQKTQSAFEKFGSQEGGKQATIKPATLMRSRLQRPMPNIVRAAGRRQVPKQESTTENRAAVYATEAESKTLADHESEQQQQQQQHAAHGIVPSPSVVEKPSFTYCKEVASPSKIQQFSKFSEILCEYESQEDQRKKPASEDVEKQNGVGPFPLVRSLFQKPKLDLGKITVKVETPLLANDAPDKKTAVEVSGREGKEPECDDPEAYSPLEQQSADKLMPLCLEVTETQNVLAAQEISSPARKWRSSQLEFSEDTGCEIEEEQKDVYHITSSVEITLEQPVVLPEEEGENTIIRQAAVMLSCSQMPETNIRADWLREISLQEESVIYEKPDSDAAEEETTEVQKCKPDLQSPLQEPPVDQEALISFDVKHTSLKLKEMVSLPQNQLSDELLSVKRSARHENQEVQEDSPQLASTEEENADQFAVKRLASEAEKQNEVKPFPLVRSLFQKPKPNLGKRDVKQGTPLLANTAPEKKIAVEDSGKEGKEQQCYELEVHSPLNQQSADQLMPLCPEVTETWTVLATQEASSPARSWKSSHLEVPEDPACKPQEEQKDVHHVTSTVETTLERPVFSAEKLASREEKETGVRPAPLIRSRFQRPKPNIEITAVKRAVVKSETETAKDRTETEVKESEVSLAHVQESTRQTVIPSVEDTEYQVHLAIREVVCPAVSHQSNSLQLTEGATESEVQKLSEGSKLVDDVSLKATLDQPEVSVDSSTSLDGDKPAGTKPAVMVRSRFQRPKPNLGRAAVRREASHLAKGPVESKTEQGSHEGKKSEQLESEPEIHSTTKKAIPSSEVKKDQSPSKTEEVVSSAEVLQPIKLKSPERCSSCEGLEEHAQGLQLASTQDEALEQPTSQKLHSQEENVSTAIKPAPLVRRRFQRPVPNLQQSAGKRSRPILGKDGAEHETKPTADRKERSEKLETGVQANTSLKLDCMSPEVLQNGDAVNLEGNAPKRCRYSVDLTSRNESQEQEAEESHASIPTEKLSDRFTRCTDKALSKEESKCNTIKPAQLLRGRLQRPKPNLGRTVVRRETLLFEKDTAEKKNEAETAEKGSPEVQDCKSEAHLSLESHLTNQDTGEKEQPSDLETEKVLSSKEEPLLNVLQSPQRTMTCESQEEKASQLATDQEQVAESPAVNAKSGAPDESKPPPIRPAQLLRTRFPKPKPNLGRAAVRKDSAVLKKNAAEMAEPVLIRKENADLSCDLEIQCSTVPTLDSFERRESSLSFEEVQESLEMSQGSSPRQSTNSLSSESPTDSPSDIHRLQETSKKSIREPLLKSPRVTSESDSDFQLLKKQTIKPAVLRNRYYKQKPSVGQVRNGSVSLEAHVAVNKSELAFVQQEGEEQLDSTAETPVFQKASPCQEEMTKDVETLEKEYSVSEESDSQTSSRLTNNLQSFASESQVEEEEVEDSVDCEDEGHIRKKIRRSARQSKPPDFYKATGLKSPSAAVSSSDGEFQTSDRGRPLSSQKYKTKVNRGRPRKDVHYRNLGNNQGAVKTTLVTIRASQDIEEDDVESDLDYDDETYLLSPEEVNKAPPFVPVSLRSPEPVPLQLEETVEELEILVNAPDAHCVCEMEHLPHDLRGFAEPVVHGGDILPSENHMGLQAEIDYTDSREEKDDFDSNTEVAMALLSIGDLTLQVSGSETMPNSVPEASDDDIAIQPAVEDAVGVYEEHDKDQRSECGEQPTSYLPLCEADSEHLHSEEKDAAPDQGPAQDAVLEEEENVDAQPDSVPSSDVLDSSLSLERVLFPKPVPSLHRSPRTGRGVHRRGPRMLLPVRPLYQKHSVEVSVGINHAQSAVDKDTAFVLEVGDDAEQTVFEVLPLSSLGPSKNMYTECDVFTEQRSGEDLQLGEKERDRSQPDSVSAGGTPGSFRHESSWTTKFKHRVHRLPGRGRGLQRRGARVLLPVRELQQESSAAETLDHSTAVQDERLGSFQESDALKVCSTVDHSEQMAEVEFDFDGRKHFQQDSIIEGTVANIPCSREDAKEDDAAANVSCSREDAKENEVAVETMPFQMQDLCAALNETDEAFTELQDSAASLGTSDNTQPEQVDVKNTFEEEPLNTTDCGGGPPAAYFNAAQSMLHEEEQTIILTLVEIPAYSLDGNDTSLTSYATAQEQFLPSPVIVNTACTEEMVMTEMQSLARANHEELVQPSDMTAFDVMDQTSVCLKNENPAVTVILDSSSNEDLTECTAIIPADSDADIHSEDPLEVCRSNMDACGIPSAETCISTEKPFTISAALIEGPGPPTESKEQSEFPQKVETMVNESISVAHCSILSTSKPQEITETLKKPQTGVGAQNSQITAAQTSQRRLASLNAPPFLPAFKRIPLSRKQNRKPLGFLPFLIKINENEKTSGESTSQMNEPKKNSVKKPVKRTAAAAIQGDAGPSMSIPPPTKSRLSSTKESISLDDDVVIISEESKMPSHTHEAHKNRESEREPTNISEFFFGDIFMEVEESESSAKEST